MLLCKHAAEVSFQLFFRLWFLEFLLFLLPGAEGETYNFFKGLELLNY